MIIEIPDLVSAEVLKELRSLMDKAEKQDGKLSAGPAAINVKSNTELSNHSNEHTRMSELVNQAIVSNQHIDLAVMPIAATVPMFARYTKGMKYGQHLDIATTTFLPSPVSSIFPGRFRADMSATLFLSGPDEYEGGELVIETQVGTRHIKGPAGSMVIYPSGYLHEVSEVTSGQRDVGVFWFQSHIANNEKRHLLFELMRATDQLIGKYPDDYDVKKVNYVYNNLVRMWVNTG